MSFANERVNLRCLYASAIMIYKSICNNFIGLSKLFFWEIFLCQKLKILNLKKSILSPLDALKKEKLNQLDKQKLKLLYARNYSVYNDVNILFKCFRNLGQK